MLSIRSGIAATIATVPVGDPGNPVDSGVPDVFGPKPGSVGYEYRIGRAEVTNAQYTEFLNAKAVQNNLLGLFNLSMSSDFRGGIVRNGSPGAFSYSTKQNMGDKPVNFVSFYDAIRFANWLHNGQGQGTTESGAYSIVGSIPSNGSTISRNVDATWFVAAPDEWHKAAFYQPAASGGDSDGYWSFATRSNSSPTLATIADTTYVISNPGFNVANYAGAISFPTSVGSAGPLSASYYGTFDQSGNIDEWTDGLMTTDSDARFIKGGSYSTAAMGISSSRGAVGRSATDELATLGFRVGAAISVPEPATWTLCVCGLLCLAGYRLPQRWSRYCTAN